MSFDSVTQATAERLAGAHTHRKARPAHRKARPAHRKAPPDRRPAVPARRTALGLFAGAAAAIGFGWSGLASRASAASGNFTLVNQTGQTIWPGVTGTSVPNGGGFELPAGGTATLSVPANWSGRIWARTDCNFNAAGSGSCATGDCGGVLACNGASGAASATLAEFTLGGGSSPDFYDVSLVDAFNLPVTIAPQGGAGCTTAGCTANLDPGCPAELQQVDSSGNIVACLSSCSKFGGDQNCCTGSFDSASTCNPANFQVNSASYFKSGCPDAFSYAFDSVTSTFTCQGASGYVITFLPFGSNGAHPSATPTPAPSTSASPTPAPSGRSHHPPWSAGRGSQRQ